MGFLSQFFKKKSGNVNAGKGPASYSHDWELYYKNIDHKLGVISVDLGIAKVAPLHYQYSLLCFSFVMTNPQENGLTSHSEQRKIEEIEQKISSKIEEIYDASYVGRKVSVGRQTMYFYIGDTLGYEQVVKSEMRAFPQYQFDFTTEEDVDWAHYFNVLYPSEFQKRSIKNKKIIDALREQGDRLDQERKVCHCMSFSSIEGRQNFLQEVQDGGFHYEDDSEDRKNTKYPYQLRISRVNFVDEDHVDQYVLLLSESAKEHGGNYLYFESPVIKD